jgi:hypothetical protein
MPFAGVVVVLVFIVMDLFLLVSSVQRFLPQQRTIWALRTLMISSTERCAGAFTKPNSFECFLPAFNVDCKFYF